MRMIDYDAVMKALEEEYQWQDHEKVAHEMLNVVKYFPTIEQPHWIPFSERMPEVDATVLVQFCDGDMAILTFPNIYRTLERVAWMPLPEPYREGEQE